ncbi:MAG: hypothetical protein V1846_03205 [Candidatus Komeilibacteria bacterium]
MAKRSTVVLSAMTAKAIDSPQRPEVAPSLSPLNEVEYDFLVFLRLWLEQAIKRTDGKNLQLASSPQLEFDDDSGGLSLSFDPIQVMDAAEFYRDTLHLLSGEGEKVN